MIEGDAGNQDAVFKVHLSRDPAQSITLDYTTSDGSAQAGQDYQTTSGQLTFTPGGSLSQEVSVPVTGDTVVEPSEFFNLVFTPSAQLASGGDGAAGTGRILDDDAHATLPVLSISDAVAGEGSSNFDKFLTFSLTLTEPAVNDVTVDFETVPGTALDDIDYDSLFQVDSLVIPAGHVGGAISVRTVADNAAETDEFFTLELTNVTNAVFAGGATRVAGTGTILDDDTNGNRLALHVGDTQLIEGDSGQHEAVFTVHLSTPSDQALSLPYTTTDGSAVAGQDYDAVTGTLAFEPGETVKAVHVPVSGDEAVEDSEFFNLALTPPLQLASGANGAAGTARILDDDADAVLPVLSISDAVAGEGSSNFDKFLTFSLTLTEPAVNDVTVDFETVPGTALDDIDYDSLFQVDSLVIPAGHVGGAISVRTVADNAAETDEFFTLELTNVTNAVFAGGATRVAGTGTILDDDTNGNRLALHVGDTQLIEGDSGQHEAVFTVHLSTPSDQALSLPYTTTDGSAVAGQDYDAVTGTLAFEPGETVKAVHVPVSGDEAVEDSEFFNLALTPPLQLASGANGAAGTARILDDDADAVLPVLSISDAVAGEGSSNFDKFLTFSLTLTEPAVNDVTVDFETVPGTALDDIDYDSLFQVDSLVIPAGHVGGAISVRTVADNAAETDEFFTLELTNVTNAVFAGGATRLAGTGTILDDDTNGNRLALYVGDTQVIEGDSGQHEAVFTVHLSTPSDEALSLAVHDNRRLSGRGPGLRRGDGHAGAFEPGETVKAVHVPVSGDEAVGGQRVL